MTQNNRTGSLRILAVANRTIRYEDRAISDSDSIDRRIFVLFSESYPADEFLVTLPVYYCFLLTF